jgi:hypothetical protein
MQTKEGRDLPVTEITPENYLVEEKDQSFFHVKVEQEQFSSRSGKRLSIPYVQLFGVKEWATVQFNLRKQNYTLIVLYDPTEYIAAHPAPATKTREERNKLADAEALKKKIEDLERERDELQTALSSQKEKTKKPSSVYVIGQKPEIEAEL